MPLQAAELLVARGIQPKIVEYLKTPPSKTEIERILNLLKLDPRALMRCKEPAYKQARLDNPKLTRAQLVEAMAEHPILLERPIVLAHGKAAIGRPPESVLDIL